MKKIICLAIALLLCLTALVSCEDKPTDTTQGSAETTAHVAPKASEIDMRTISKLDGVTESETETDFVIIDVADFGKIVVRLYPDVAPASVANFKKLVSEKFYDGLIFHRVKKGFMIQGGGFTPDMEQKESATIKGEFASNGFANNLSHARGVIAMARTNVPDSASSQFYICHKTSRVEGLNGDYATFGYTIYGLDVVDKIAGVKTQTKGYYDDVPASNVVINSIRFANVPAELFEQTGNN